MKYLREHLIAVVSVLESLSETADDATTRCDAQGLLRQLKTWENMFLLKVFYAVPFRRHTFKGAPDLSD